MILAVDLGNFNIKTSEDIIFSSRFVKGGDYAPVGEETIEYDDSIYTMEKGEFENKFNKAKKNYIPNLLYAIGKSTTSKDKEIDLVLGVPADNMKLAETFKTELKDKEFKFKINGSPREVKINRVAVIAEGMSSFYTLNKSQREEDVLIIDIGGRTVNVVSFVNGKVEHKFTIGKGIIDLYNAIKTKINANGENYTVIEIERLMNNNAISDIEDDKVDFFKGIMNDIELELKYNTYKLYFTGGGSIVLDEAIVRTLNTGNFIPNPLFSNVEGNKKVAQLKWSK